MRKHPLIALLLAIGLQACAQQPAMPLPAPAPVVAACPAAHAVSCPAAPVPATRTVTVNAPVLIGFSPARGQASAEAIVLETVAGARKTIRVAAYSFTSKPISQALADAHARGVDVQAVIDKTNRPKKNSEGEEKFSAAAFLAQQGVPVRINAHYAIMHNKFMVIDGATLQTGSFNYTASAAQRNAENVIVVQDRAAAKRYLAEWQALWDEAEALAQ